MLENETNVNYEILGPFIVTYCLKYSLRETYFKLDLIKIIKFKNASKVSNFYNSLKI